jgi:hypothetical protein
MPEGWEPASGTDELPEGAVWIASLCGPREVAELFDVALGTVNVWRQRGVLPLPVASVQVGRGASGHHLPLWSFHELEEWGVRTGRLEAHPGLGLVPKAALKDPRRTWDFLEHFGRASRGELLRPPQEGS